MTACAPGSESGEPSPQTTAGAGVEFPAGAAFDYQLGAAYPLPDGVAVVTRDRTAEPAADAYSICYLNGFQTQPGEIESWPDDALLRIDGEVRTDPDWPDEAILDIATEAGRTIVIDRVSTWIEGCRDAGFAAVEFDNLDTFTRSDGAISRDDAAIVATALVAAAHDAGLAAGQKNAAEHAAWLRDEAGFDFAVSEECAAFDECGTYTEVYGDAVMDIEYTDALPRPFGEVCGDEATPRATILRDRALVAPNDPDYVFEVC